MIMLIIIMKMVLCEADIHAISEVVFFALLGISSILNGFLFQYVNFRISNIGTPLIILWVGCEMRQMVGELFIVVIVVNVCVCVCLLFLALKQRYRLLRVVRNMGMIIMSEVL
jgi:hypothetical protein